MYGKAKRVLLNLSFILAIFCICLFFLLIVLIPQFEDLYFSTIDELVLGLPVFLGCFLFFLAYDSEYSYEPTFLRIFALVLGWILVIPFGLLTLLFLKMINAVLFFHLLHLKYDMPYVQMLLLPH